MMPLAGASASVTVAVIGAFSTAGPLSEIVADGPTETNAYVLKVAAERRVEAAQALRAEPAVVLVEQLDR